MEEKELKNLLDQYLKGECTPEEASYLESWLDQLSAQGEIDETLDKVAVMQRLKRKIDTQIRKDRFFTLPVMLRVAAAVLFISSVAGFFLLQSTRLKHFVDPVMYSITTVPRGQRIKLTLSDGSTVMLNAGSSIRYPEKFTGTTRSVALLEGEAFFDIKHSDDKPFVVAAAGTQTQVLGTTFNVQAYQHFREVKVTVVQGKVAVKGKQTAIVLLPDEQMTVNTATGHQDKKHINAEESIGWIKGKLFFRNETLLNVALILENSYNVKIAFKNKATSEIRFTANFNSTDSLEKILFAISKANGITYSIKDKIVQF